MAVTSGVVLDLGWLDALYGLDSPSHPNRKFSTGGQQAQFMRDALFDEAMSNLTVYGMSNILLFAEQLVINDAFYVDKIALDARIGTIPEQLSQYIVRRVPDKEVYINAAKEVQRLVLGLNDLAHDSLESKLLLQEMTIDSEREFYGHQKVLHDFMHKSGQYVESAESTKGDTFARALFYLEFGRKNGDVPLLGDGKSAWLEKIGKSVQLSFHQLLAKHFDESSLADILGSPFGEFATLPLETAPIAELILKNSIAQGISIIDAAIQLRNTAEAEDYRGMLTEFRGFFQKGRSGIIAAQKAFQGLNKLAKSWAEHSNSLVGVNIQPRTLTGKKVPYIGLLLDAVGMSSIEIKDRILNAPPGYLAFMSSWYREPK